MIDYHPKPRRWGITNDYGPLMDVLLGTPEFYRWTDAGPITMRTLNNQEHTGVEFNLQTAMSQHAEMVSIYESNGVRCHYLDADEALHRNFFARDSSAMTPWGPLICHMQLKSRRADYVTAIRFYQDNGIPIWRYATAGHFEGGDFNILEPGFVLIGFCGERSEREGSEQVAGWVREQGWEAVVAPISREFVHMDGLVVPLAPKLLVACVEAMEDWLVALLRAPRLRVRGGRLCGGQEPRRQPGRARQRARALDAGVGKPERAIAGHGVRGVRPGHVDVHAGRRRRALPQSGAAPGRSVEHPGHRLAPAARATACPKSEDGRYRRYRPSRSSFQSRDHVRSWRRGTGWRRPDGVPNEGGTRGGPMRGRLFHPGVHQFAALSCTHCLA